jgi:hypothetical protein
MSLVAITVDIARQQGDLDAYGGKSDAWTTKYSDLPALFNYPARVAVSRYESGPGGASGPGVTTRTTGIIVFEPIPANTTILVNDRVSIDGGDKYKVIGVRTYEYTLQLDVERISGWTDG